MVVLRISGQRRFSKIRIRDPCCRLRFFDDLYDMIPTNVQIPFILYVVTQVDYIDA